MKKYVSPELEELVIDSVQLLAESDLIDSTDDNPVKVVETDDPNALEAWYSGTNNHNGGCAGRF